MNMRCMAGFAVLAAMAGAAETPFSEAESKIELPALELNAAARGSLPPTFTGEMHPLAPEQSVTSAGQKFSMKVLKPGELAGSTGVKKPDDATHYTLITKDPGGVLGDVVKKP